LDPTPLRWAVRIALALLVCAAPAVWSQPVEEAPPLGTFGLGLEDTGSACCFSVRFWVPDGRGSEIVLNAYDADLFVTLRPRDEWSRAATQAELTELIQRELREMPGQRIAMTQLRFGEMHPESPSLFMAFQGFLALEGPFPFLEPLIGNLEATIEFRPDHGFRAELGLGAHVYF